MRRWPLTLSAAAGAILFAAASLAQTAAPIRIRGTIDAVDGSVLRVTSRAGETMTLRLAPQATITAILPAKLGDIKDGTYIGTAAMPGPDGSLVALEVQVFPESMRGVGEGHRPFDLEPQSTMTNATAAGVVVTANDGRTLTLEYKGGEKKLTVPAGVPVITYAPGDTTLLKPGAHFIVLGATRQPDGTLTADRINVGKDGLVPPM